MIAAESGAAAATPPPSPLAKLALFGAAFLAMLDLSISMVALPALRDGLQASLSGLQWTVDAYTLCFAGLLLVGGLISDRLGHRTALLLSVTLFVVGSAVCTGAPNLGVLITGRAIQGAAAAVLVPGCMALIAHLFPDPAQRVKMLGLWSALSGIAVALGPVIGGTLVDLAGWRTIFGINLPLGAVVLFCAAKALPVTQAQRGRRLDVAGVVLGIVWAFSLAFAVIEGGSRGWGSPLIIGAFAVAALGLAAFLVVESRAEHAMLPLSLFRLPVFAAAGATAFVLGCSLSTAFYFLSLYLQQVLDYSPMKAGLGFLPAAAAMALAARYAAKLAATFKPRTITVTGLGAGMIGLAGLAFTGPDTPFALVGVALVLIGAGLGIAIPHNNSTALGSVPPTSAGAASGTIQTLMQFGTVIGIAVLGAVQAGGFHDALRERLAGLGVGADAARQAVDAISEGTVPALEGVQPKTLVEAVSDTFAHGLQHSWAVAAVIAAVGALAVLLVRPAPAPPAAAPATAAEPTKAGAAN
ncbi:MFS transporter [Streptomyces sp. NPDC048718]|uniref:MFS transporter n=1 Tax=Streptomyces sp. NPDC048718 TaxID=3365587 RepID=UPI00371920F2